MFIPRLLITPGDPAGIGPDVTLMALQQSFSAEIIVVACPELLQERAEQLGLKIRIEIIDWDKTARVHYGKQIRVAPIALSHQVIAGQPDAKHADYVLSCLQFAKQQCLSQKAHALVTGPVAKSIINEAGINFSGHTEYLGGDEHEVVMMLSDGKLRVALATTHIALREVSNAISEQRIYNSLQILNHNLIKHCALTDPRIIVCGLNPHAGEQGHMGDEEQRFIMPAIKRARAEGMRIEGPLAADTAFTPKYLQSCDAVLTMYHDQGLPTLKALSFGEIVNITLGLPFLRTSVDHGTAFDIAGTGQANADSLLKVLYETLKLTHQHHEHHDKVLSPHS